MREDDSSGKEEILGECQVQPLENQRPPRIKVRTEIQSGAVDIGSLGGNGMWNP